MVVRSQAEDYCKVLGNNKESKLKNIKKPVTDFKIHTS